MYCIFLKNIFSVFFLFNPCGILDALSAPNQMYLILLNALNFNLLLSLMACSLYKNKFLK